MIEMLRNDENRIKMNGGSAESGYDTARGGGGGGGDGNHEEEEQEEMEEAAHQQVNMRVLALVSLFGELLLF